MAGEEKKIDDAITKNDDSEGREVIMDKEDFRDEFQCCVCLDLMYKPVVLACGHISCFWCVFIAMDTSDHSHCPVCRSPFSHFPRVCESMHRLLLTLYPEIYRNRAKQVAEEEKKRGQESQQFEEKLTDSQVGEVHQNDSNSGREENPCVQHSSEGSASCKDDNDDEKSTMKDSDNTSKKLLTHLQCGVCRQLLFCPVVLNCGHVFCEACVHRDDSACRCPACRSLHPNGFPSVCLALHHFLEDYFPEEYSLRKESLTTNTSSSGGPEIRDNAAPTDVPTRFPLPGRARLVHRGVGCDYCGMCPIVGERYRCRDCTEAIGFDLCEECHRSSSKLPGRFNQRHTPEHKFDLVTPPLSTAVMTLGAVGVADAGGGEYAFWAVDDSEESSSETYSPGADHYGDEHVSPDPDHYGDEYVSPGPDHYVDENSPDADHYVDENSPDADPYGDENVSPHFVLARSGGGGGGGEHDNGGALDD